MHFVKPTWLNSISLKILLAYIGGAVLTVALAIILILWLVTYKSDWLAGEDVADFIKEIPQVLQFDEQGNPIGFHDSEEDLEWIFQSLKQEAAYRILDASGKTVLSSAATDEFWQPEEKTRRLELGKFEFERDGFLFHGATAKTSNHGKDWYIQFAVSSRFFYLMHRGFALPFMGVGIVLFSIVLLLVFAVFASVTLGYTLKPLRQLSESAASISLRSLDARLSSKGVPLEIAPLVESFNWALDRLGNGYRVQKDFMATAAHELKTPLALIRAQIEVLDECDDRNALLNDVSHMTRHVQQLLLLAEVSEEQNYKLISVYAGEVVDEVVVYLQPMTKKANVLIRALHHSDVNWRADSSALFVLLKNLLENAIQHAPNSTEVHIEVEPSKITVRDWGPGANDDQLEHMFERFWRGAHRRDHGAGLGLAICKEIAQAHGWDLSVQKAEPGLCFQIVNEASLLTKNL